MANILVVDDELGIRDLLSEILNDEGHSVDLAENATQARSARASSQKSATISSCSRSSSRCVVTRGSRRRITARSEGVNSRTKSRTGPGSPRMTALSVSASISGAWASYDRAQS